MTKKGKRIALLLLLLAVCFGAAACSRGFTDDTQLRKEGYVVTVTFDFLGGTSRGRDSVLMYFKRGQLLTDPAGVNRQPELDRHVLVGWYREGDDQQTDVGEIRLLRATEDMTLCAIWARAGYFSIVYLDGAGAEVPLTAVRAAEGDIFTPPNLKSLPSAYQREGFTCLGFFSDKELQNQWDSTFAYPDPDSLPEGQYDIPVYTRWIEGTYRLADTAADMASVVQNSNLVDHYRLRSDANFYLRADIDFLAYPWDPVSYGGTIKGNGFTIRGIRAALTDDLSRQVNNFGVFRELYGAALLENVRFEDVQIVIDIDLSQEWRSGDLRAALLAGTIGGTAVIDNCFVSGTIEVREAFAALENTVGREYAVKEGSATVTNPPSDMPALHEIVVNTSGKTLKDPDGVDII